MNIRVSPKAVSGTAALGKTMGHLRLSAFGRSRPLMSSIHRTVIYVVRTAIRLGNGCRGREKRAIAQSQQTRCE